MDGSVEPFYGTTRHHWPCCQRTGMCQRTNQGSVGPGDSYPAAQSSVKVLCWADLNCLKCLDRCEQSKLSTYIFSCAVWIPATATIWINRAARFAHESNPNHICRCVSFLWVHCATAGPAGRISFFPKFFSDSEIWEQKMDFWGNDFIFSENCFGWLFGLERDVTEPCSRQTCVQTSYLYQQCHRMFTENYTIKIQFSQQGPIRYNPRASRYNSWAIQRDAGSRLHALCPWNRHQTRH